MKQLIMKKHIARLAAFAVCAVLIAACLAGCRGRRNAAIINDDDSSYWETWANSLPTSTGDFQAENLDGVKIGREVFSNYKLTMLNVWATWCGPCLSEMPDLEKVARAREKDGVQIIGIVIDTYAEKGGSDDEKVKLTKDILKKLGVNYLVIRPDKTLEEGLLKDIQAVPTTFFVGPDGRLIGRPEIGSRSELDWNTVISGLLQGAS